VEARERLAPVLAARFADGFFPRARFRGQALGKGADGRELEDTLGMAMMPLTSCKVASEALKYRSRRALKWDWRQRSAIRGTYRPR
jgi:hypothetical protein